MSMCGQPDRLEPVTSPCLVLDVKGLFAMIFDPQNYGRGLTERDLSCFCSVCLSGSSARHNGRWTTDNVYQQQVRRTRRRNALCFSVCRFNKWIQGSDSTTKRMPTDDSHYPNTFNSKLEFIRNISKT